MVQCNIQNTLSLYGFVLFLYVYAVIMDLCDLCMLVLVWKQTAKLDKCVEDLVMRLPCTGQ